MILYIAVCEDEKRARAWLTTCLNMETAQRKLSATVLAFESGEALLEAGRRIQFSIYFLDILMSGINGMSLARILRKKNSDAAIVFTTFSENYYADAFAVGAVHYLLKPLKEQDVSEALDRCLRQVGEVERYIEVIINRETHRILYTELIWAESRDKVCELHLKSGNFRTYLRLDVLEQKLGEPRFLRCHRSFLVNMDYIIKVERGFFYMSDLSKIPLKQDCRAQLRTAYRDYIFNKKIRKS